MRKNRSSLNNIVDEYRRKSQTIYENGGRDYYLPCEYNLGDHCSKLFQEDMREFPLNQSIMNHLQRCPKGPLLGFAGLVSATLMLIIPFSGSCPDACSRLTNSCFDCGENISRSVG